MTRWLFAAPRMAKSVAWWRVFIAGATLCLAAPVVELALGAPGGTGVWTMGYGIAATALGAAALAYTARRRAPRLGPGGSYHWMQLHVYGGTLFVFLVAVHARGRMPAGPLAWGLWASSLWIVGTGLAGVFIQKWVPTSLTSGLMTEVHYDRIPELVRVVRERVELLVAVGDESIRTFYYTNLAGALAEPQTRLIYFVDITGGIKARLRPFDYLRKFLDADDARRLEELRALVRMKLEMDAQYTLQKALRWWVYAHAPVALALVVLVVVHVFAVLYY